MYLVHQIVGVLTDPLFVSLLVLAVGLVFVRRRFGRVLLLVDLVATWVCAMPITSEILARWIERDFSPARLAQDYPQADAIILLGGGVWAPPEGGGEPYPDLKEAADRAWHAARLYKAGRAPKIYCTGSDVGRSTPPFLHALGVPPDAVVSLDGPRNTEEEARLLNEKVEGREGTGVRTALLVTSAAHMKRAVTIFRNFAPDLRVTPAAIDSVYKRDPNRKFDVRRFVPGAGALSLFNSILHELIGLVRYSF